MRPRDGNPDTSIENGALVTFEEVFEPAPPGTPATPRPPGRPRETEATTETDAAFARELADRVLEYVRTRPAGLTAEQLAALVQQFLTRRPA